MCEVENYFDFPVNDVIHNIIRTMCEVENYFDFLVIDVTNNIIKIICEVENYFDFLVIDVTYNDYMKTLDKSKRKFLTLIFKINRIKGCNSWKKEVKLYHKYEAHVNL